MLDQKNLFLPISILVAATMITGAIVYTNISQKSDLGPKAQEATGVVSPGGAGGALVKKELSVDKEDHVRGSFEAPVTIVEFSDFECPFCSRFHPTVQQILADYPDQVRWVYKHFPLDQIHPQARPSAEASECAAELKANEGFWQFADGLFENQSRLGENLYTELAENLGLNMAQFENCVSSGKYKDHVEEDYQEGIQAGVRGTPGSFVNGESVSGAVPYETLKAAVERALVNLE